MYQEGNLLTVQEFWTLTSLSARARTKFEEFGFIHPQITPKGVLYRAEDGLLVNTMETFLDGKNDLRTAYNKALAAMQALAA